MELKNSKLRVQLRAEAREVLEGQWGIAALLTLVCIILASIISGGMPHPDPNAVLGTGYLTHFGLGFLIVLLLAPVLGYGYAVTFLQNLRSDKIQIGKLFQGFRTYTRVISIMLLVFVYTLLWTLLLIIPGIIKQYSYAMTPYIIHDDAEIGANAAIEKSMKMMDGYKWQLFVLDLSFLGWYLLGLLTLCIGWLFVFPYHYSARAAFYEKLKAAA